MYNGDYFFVDNPLNRYTLSPRDKLAPNPDGSTDLYIQADSPGPDKESNWLPAPKDRFSPHAAAVLAQREEAVDSGRDVAHPTGQARPLVTSAARRRTRCPAPGP